jgi:hypothetical protein
MKHHRWIGLLAGGALCAAVLGGATAQSPAFPPGPQSPGGTPERSEGERASAEGVIVNSPAAAAPSSVAVGAAFSYQGQLKLGGALVNGSCDMAFRAFDASLTGNQIGDAISTTVSLNNGLFTFAPLAFGTGAFEGDTRWLEITVRCPSGTGAYQKLTPRQQLWAAPYALTLRPGATISATTSGAVLSLENYSDNGRAAYVRNNGSSLWAALRVENVGDSWGIYATSVGGTAIEATSTQGEGVIGKHTALTGTLAGVTGNSSSTDPNAVGVLGEIVSTTPGNSSAGVRGINNGTGASGIGVWGSHDGSGWGVYGESTSGRGVSARSNGSGVTNPALYAINTHTGAEPDGIAIYAENASGDSTIVANNTSTGDTFRAIKTGSGAGVTFRVTHTGTVWAYSFDAYGGGDLAEKFGVSSLAGVEPGVLMVIDEDNPGKLKMSTTAYDYKVAGVVSGAGGAQPGMTLHQAGVLDGDTTVAVVGRVYVKADASYGSIRPGDLLTTSDTPGHAMKAGDIARAQGAIVGKAMTGLAEGTGLVLLLVNLQ